MLEIFELLFRCLGGGLVTAGGCCNPSLDEDDEENKTCTWCCSKPVLTNYDKPFLRLYT
jgi:hypothetical protein